ncbi:DUF4179 domain-containing protein [Caloramator sp. mosi_1]|uniref:DUF4179 domain-containing protein n=1 Tax=Caloramator sp. mosi_1 TaxID=3023090 RepID=UPI0023605348|nr:DUF4179 domain-containing protein [Caloramator sp. mosi_1]WDC85394.1 DUF4179 domain-containing protein [Caloramator sp. mosi_1]
MINNFEDNIKDLLSQDIKIPDSVLSKAELAFEQIRYSEDVKTTKFKEFKRQSIAAVAVICVLSLTVFGGSAFALIRALFSDKGIQNAVENGYVQSSLGNVVKDNGVAISVDDIVVDKTKMAVSFTLNFDDKSKLRNVSDILLGLTIKDYKGIIIEEDGNADSVVRGLFSKIDASQKEKGELKYYLEMYSTSGEITGIDNVIIDINSVNLFEEDKGKNIENINGNWKFSLKLDDKFTESKEIKFRAENKSDIIEIVSAKMLPTGMSIECIVNKPVDENIINKINLIDEQGNIYIPSPIASIDSISNNRNVIKLTFDATLFQSKDKLIMRIRDIYGKNEEIRLVKE